MNFHEVILKIAIIVDNPIRDLPSCALLASILSKTHETYLISASNAGTEIFQINADLVLLNSLRETNKHLIYKLINSQISYSVLDTEGGLFMDIPNTDENTYTITLPKDPVLRQNLAQYFLWGNETTSELIKRKLFDDTKLFCLGTPRMDFFSSPLKQLISSKQSLNHRNPMILINTSFAGNNPRYSNRAAEMKMLIQKFNYTEKFITEFFDNLDKTHLAYIELTLFLAKKFPNIDFVLRPHPFENEEVYKNKFASQPNIKVILQGSAAEWITQSVALVHFECSTAIEAAVLGIPVFSLSEFKYVRPLQHIQSISDYADSFEEMAEKLNLILEKKYQRPNKLHENLKKIESNLYYKIDGLSHIRIANSINEFDKKTERKLSLRGWSYRLIYKLFFNIRALVKMTVKGYLIPPGKSIQLSELNEFYKKLNSIQESNTKVKQLKKYNIFKIVH